MGGPAAPLAAGEQTAHLTPVTGLPDATCPPRLPVRLQSERSRDIPGLRGPHGSKRWGTSTRHALLSPPPNTHTKKSLHRWDFTSSFSGELPGGPPAPGSQGPGLQVHSHNTMSADTERHSVRWTGAPTREPGDYGPRPPQPRSVGSATTVHSQYPALPCGPRSSPGGQAKSGSLIHAQPGAHGAVKKCFFPPSGNISGKDKSRGVLGSWGIRLGGLGAAAASGTPKQGPGAGLPGLRGRGKDGLLGGWHEHRHPGGG